MRRTIARISIFTALIISLGFGLFLVAVGTANQALHYVPTVQVQGGMLSSISAKSIYIFDLESQAEIFSRSADTQRPIASVTKLLSSALFSERADGTATTTITWSDVSSEGRSGRLQAAQEYQNKELLFPALLESSNDAAAAMQRVAPVDLVDTMNTYATEHQLLQTHFTDASGLDDSNVSTARELSMLSTVLYMEYPHIFDITRLKTYLNHINAWMNNNPFVHEVGYKGGKHGYTNAANRTAVAFFDESLPSGQVRTVGYVLLGSDSLQTDMKRLRQYVQTSVVYQ